MIELPFVMLHAQLLSFLSVQHVSSHAKILVMNYLNSQPNIWK